MKILFLHPNYPDYAGDGLLHGLRQILGNNCIDVPRADYMYDDYPPSKWKGVANEGKVLYGLLQDNESLQQERLNCFGYLDDYSFLVISNPIGFGPGIRSLYSKVNIRRNRTKIAWIDGSDTNRFFPFTSIKTLLFKNPLLFFSDVKYGWYFKREFGGFELAAPGFLSFLCRPYKVFPFGISIPEKHITIAGNSRRTKSFPDYVVDEEAARKLGKAYGPVGKHRFVFRTEKEYWNDIDESRFGPTTRRAGWDALRHYEYAARGTVLCFKDLDLKPKVCAPHGLNEDNCLIYHSFDDLVKKIESITQEEYELLQQRTQNWVSRHTTVQEARRFIDILLTQRKN